jgi:hypothetical protein
MKIGISGHQRRPGIDWTWVRREIETLLAKQGCRPHIGYSSLAAGSDQIFAQTILDRKDRLVTVVPSDDYDSCFRGRDLSSYRVLRRRSSVIKLGAKSPSEGAFYSAGMFIVDNVQLLIAVWDGKSSEGFGGTADIVEYARETVTPIAHVNPLARQVRTLKHG